MEPILALPTAFLVAMAAAMVFEVLYPPAVALLVNRRLGVRWRYFGYGALIFLVFQLLTRIPAITILQAALAPQLQASREFALAFLVGAALTAGLFEEVGRYVGYRWLWRGDPKTWDRAVMYGVGHGGLESMLFVGGATLLGLINLILIPSLDLSAAPIPAEQRAALLSQFQALQALPGWFPLLAAWERLWTLPVHVALSVMVLQVFRRGSLAWLWLAIAAHTLVNLVVVGVSFLREPLGLDAVTLPLLQEGLVALSGLLALWATLALRDRPAASAAPAAAPVP
jgi:uncharacterized membrane protein YhfC